jgi:hypothetical protein
MQGSKNRFRALRTAAGAGAAALVLLASSGHAGAQDAAADRAAVKKCLGDAQEADKFGGGCIGIIADPCIKDPNKAKAQTVEAVTAAEKACANRELAVWTELMQAAVKKVQRGGFKDISQPVADAQKSWAASRDKLCPVFDKIEPGMYVGGSAYCRLQETARRALSLDKLGDAVNEH